MSPNDNVRFLARLKELARFGYSPEYALRRAMQEDAEGAAMSPQADGTRADDEGQSVTLSQKREELRYEMERSLASQGAGTVRGVAGVFRRGGLTFEEMAEKLRQEPAYAHIRNADDLVDLLHTAIFGTTSMEAQGVPLSPAQLRDQLGIDTSKAWWKDSWRGPGRRKVDPGGDGES